MSLPTLNALQKEASEFTIRLNESVADDLGLSLDKCYVDELGLANANCILPFRSDRFRFGFISVFGLISLINEITILI